MTTLTLKSPEEIVARIREVEADGNDWLGIQHFDLLEALPFDAARPFLKPEATADQWTGPLTAERVHEVAVGYLPFAYGKASDHRGISADRSTQHFRAWLWLIGLLPDDWDSTEYANYGTPLLFKAATALGQPLPTDPDLVRMSQGLPCEPGCDGGCGS